MTLDTAVELIRHAFLLTLLITAPILVIGLVIGFVLSLLQAVTQLHEQTLSLIPRMVAMVVGAVLLLPWMGQHLIEYAKLMFTDGLMR